MTDKTCRLAAKAACIAVFGSLLLHAPVALAEPFGISVQDSPYNAACNGTTDDSSALNSAVQAAISGGVNAVYIPPGCRLGLNATQVTLQYVKLSGTGPMDVGGSSGNYGATASQIWLYNPTSAPFILQSGAAIENMSFYWPNQTSAVEGATYAVTVSGSTGSGQTDTLTVRASSTAYATQTISVSIPQNTSAAAAALSVAQAVNGNSTLQTHGVFAATDNIIGNFSLSSPSVTTTWSATSGTHITLTLSAIGQPVAYPPLFLNNQSSTSAQINRFDFINSQVTNAFDFLAEVNPAAAGSSLASQLVIGQAHIAGSQIYAINNVLTLTNQPEIFKITDTYFSYGTYGAVGSYAKKLDNQPGLLAKHRKPDDSGPARPRTRYVACVCLRLWQDRVGKHRASRYIKFRHIGGWCW